MTGYLPKLAGALAILVGFWIAGLIVAAIIRGALRRTQIDDKIYRTVSGDQAAPKGDTEKWISRGVFYIIMLFGLVGFFNALGLLLVTEPINRMLESVFEFAPRILSAALLLLLAWVVARLVRAVLERTLTAVRLDERPGDVTAVEGQAVSTTRAVSSLAYWLILFLFLPLILDALKLGARLEPLQAMLTRLLAFLPNLFAAGIILLVGWLAARIVRQVLTNLLAGAGLDRVGERAGVGKVLGGQGLSGLVGMLAYALILIPVLIAALDALQLGAVSEPAGQMLTTILYAIPSVLTAALILGIAYLVGRIVAGLVKELLARVGFDNILDLLGIARRARQGQRTPSEMAGGLVLVITMFFAAIEASRQLGLDALAGLLVRFGEFAGHVLLGIAIFGVGLYVANLAAGVIRSSRPQQRVVLANAARFAILVLAGAMALREMGLADDIVNIAFGALLLSIAVAAALAIGLGSRDIAAREVEQWIRALKSADDAGGPSGPPQR